MRDHTIGTGPCACPDITLFGRDTACRVPTGGVDTGILPYLAALLPCLLAALLCIVLLCGGASAAADGKLVVTLAKDAYITAGPRANLGRYPLNANIFEALTSFDQQFRLQPCLATSWQYQGERTWRFILRKGVRFHDGSPFDAAAVQASLEAQQAAGTLLFRFEQISAPDPHTLLITTPEENLILPYILS
ncbi:MAG: hypothetical protein D3908_08250, partial [Candidatus Electrothrix sp. AUS4]|nr:hypothetical protein [Candidatus Electrothrix sp. AUS4]